MIFNGLFSSSKVSALFSSWFCLDIVLSHRCPGGTTHVCSAVHAAVGCLGLSASCAGHGRGSAGLAFASGWGWCLLEETSVVQAEQ